MQSRRGGQRAERSEGCGAGSLLGGGKRGAAGKGPEGGALEETVVSFRLREVVVVVVVGGQLLTGARVCVVIYILRFKWRYVL